jgi:hypothetical protein
LGAPLACACNVRVFDRAHVHVCAFARYVAVLFVHACVRGHARACSVVLERAKRALSARVLARIEGAQRLVDARLERRLQQVREGVWWVGGGGHVTRVHSRGPSQVM